MTVCLYAVAIQLELVNFSTESQALAKVVVNYGLDFSKVSAFLSDVMYMCSAFSDVLQGTMPSVIHVTFNAHFLLMAIDIWCTRFLDVDMLVSSFKKIFKHCVGCKLRFKELMANQSGS